MNELTRESEILKSGINTMYNPPVCLGLNISKRNLQRALRIERSLTAATKLRIIFNCPILRQMGIIFPKCRIIWNHTTNHE